MLSPWIWMCIQIHVNQEKKTKTPNHRFIRYSSYTTTKIDRGFRCASKSMDQKEIQVPILIHYKIISQYHMPSSSAILNLQDQQFMSCTIIFVYYQPSIVAPWIQMYIQIHGAQQPASNHYCTVDSDVHPNPQRSATCQHE